MGPEASVLGGNRDLLERLSGHRHELGGREGLRDEVVGSPSHCIERRLDGGVRRHQHDLGGGTPLLRRRQHVQARSVGHN